MRQDGRSTSKILPAVERFRPERGHLVRKPPGDGPGFWCGAPGSYFDSDSRRFYLYFRLRYPLDQGRGREFRIASSPDGLDFDDVTALILMT